MSGSARRSHLVVATALVALVAPTLPGQRAWLDRLPQEEEAVKFHFVDFSSLLALVELPGQGPIRGLAYLDGLAWLARGETLIAFDALSGKVVRERPAPAGLLGLAADGRFLYVLQKDAVHVFDAMAMEAVRQLQLPAPEGDDAPCAIACLGDRVYVATGQRLVALDPGSGDARESPVPVKGLQWLAGDGVDLWGGRRNWIHRLDLAGVARVASSRRLPQPVSRGAGGFVGKRLLCAFDYQDDLEVGQHAAGYLRPETAVVPVERLSLKIYRDRQGLKYEVGPKPLRTLALVKLELTRIAQSPMSMIPGPDGKRMLMPVELEAYPGVLVKDLAVAWDTATAAGFTAVLCAQADAARQVVEPPPPPPGRPGKGKR